MVIIAYFRENAGMKRRYKKLDLFSVVNTTILLFMAFICLMPILNVLAISFSEQGAVAAGKVGR